MAFNGIGSGLVLESGFINFSSTSDRLLTCEWRDRSQARGLARVHAAEAGRWL
jgi:hypothetical protein